MKLKEELWAVSWHDVNHPEDKNISQYKNKHVAMKIVKRLNMYSRIKAALMQGKVNWKKCNNE